MTRVDKRDLSILALLYGKREMSFTDFENRGIMAKSTLNDHLHALLEAKTVRKAIGKNPPHVNHPVYVITAKGRRAYEGMSKVRGRMRNLDEF